MAEDIKPLGPRQALSRRLERAEGTAGARFIEARGRVSSQTGACWIEVAGAYAMFDGPDSPLTQTFGLGLFHVPSAEEMDTIEAFFEQRNAEVAHEVSPIADKGLLQVLPNRGYRPIELTSVMFLPLAGRSPSNLGSAPRVRIVDQDEAAVWAQTAAEGWRELTDFASNMQELMRIVVERDDSPCFLAEIDGRPVAAGALSLYDGVALLAGASTIPEWRRRGAQQALLEGRLVYAAAVGCDLAMICAEPGSGSERNALRQGFQVAYTRIKWAKRK